MKVLVIQAYRAKTPTAKGLYVLLAAEDVRPQTKINIGDESLLATRAQVPDKLLRIRFRGIKAAQDAAKEAGYDARTVQAITNWRHAD